MTLGEAEDLMREFRMLRISIFDTRPDRSSIWNWSSIRSWIYDFETLRERRLHFPSRKGRDYLKVGVSENLGVEEVSIPGR